MPTPPDAEPDAAPDLRPTARPDAEPAVLDGLVVRSTGSWYNVRTDAGDDILARARGRFRLDALDIDETNPLAVGDRVELRVEKDHTALVTAIRPRHNQLSRRAAGSRGAVREHVIVANVDMAWCVQSVYGPKFNPGFVDRFLIAAEARHVAAGLVLNKTDLMAEQPKAQAAMEFWSGLYRDLGYPVLFTSAETGEGVDALRDALKDRVSVVSGPSGVGKSSLLNVVEPGLGLRTSHIGLKTQKGRHTTTFATLYEASGGWVADTPGVREFGIWDMSPTELGGYFVEFRPFIPDCRFPNCTHVHEPDCKVIAAVDAGEITDERYASYLGILETVEVEYKNTQQKRWRTVGRPDDPDAPVEDIG